MAESSFAAALKTERKAQELSEPFGTAIFNELVKSFGLKVENGRAEWSIGNIAQSFKDEPFWTTLDYALLAAAPAKAGLAAAKGLRAANPAAAAYKRGEIGLRQFQKLEAQRRSGFFTNPIRQGIKPDDDVLKAMDKFGYDTAQARGLTQTLENERIVTDAYNNRMAQDLIRGWSGMDPAVRAKAARFLEHSAADPIKYKPQVEKALGKEAAGLYEKTWLYRNSIHEESYRLGLIGRDSYVKNLKSYNPRVYREFVEVEKAAGGIPAGGYGKAVERYLKRADEPVEGLTQILDPRVSLAELARAGSVISRQQFVQNLGRSTISKTADEWGEHFLRYSDSPKIMKSMGINQEVVRLAETGRVEDALKAYGAVQMKDLAKRWGGGKLPGYVSRLPKEMLEQYVDPAAMDQVNATFSAFQKAAPDRLSDTLRKAYYNSLGFFRAGKTAYNPATHARNFIGNIIFHNLATSSMKLTPTRGIQSYLKGDEGYEAAVKAGVLGTSFSQEIREAAVKAIGGQGEAGTLDWLGSSKVARLLQRGAGKLEDIYAAEDEVWKLDAFLSLRDKAVRKGLKGADASEFAAAEVSKYMPSFMMHSPVGNMLRTAIPFASFTNEALRVWKNAIVEKPVLAFMWNHMAESMTQISGMAAGFSPDEIQSAQEMLPYYQRGKKMALLPFDVGGKPSFLDLSYLIPMANISEAGDAEQLFFGALYDPTANPILNIMATAATGVDPFTRREAEPRRFERLTGIPVEQEHARRLIGLGEHMLATLSPPLAPGVGYAAQNLAEWASGERHAETGQPLEPDLLRTVAANIMGLRAYEATPAGHTTNIRKEERDQRKRMTRWRQRLKTAMANNDQRGIDRASQAILSIKEHQDPGSGRQYLAKAMEKLAPGGYRNMSRRQLEETIRRTEEMGLDRLNSQDRAAYEAMKRELRRRRR